MAKEKSKEISKKEAEELVVSLANAGYSQSKIGLVLRDEHKIMDFTSFVGKSIGMVLEENKLLGEIPEDLLNLIKKSVMLNSHLEKNKKDFSAKRGYELTVSKIRKLAKYYIKKKKLPSDWRYTPQKAALLVR